MNTALNFQSVATKIFLYSAPARAGEGATVEKKRTGKALDVGERKLRPAIALYNYLTSQADALNVIRKGKEALANVFDVTPQTVGNWLRVLADYNVLKYKYSGIARLNPIFYHFGTDEERETALKEYELFRSDI